MPANINENWKDKAVDDFEEDLLKYAFSIIKDIERARDAVQDTFLKLVKEEKDIREYLKQWLFKVCRNRLYEILRKENKMQTMDMEAVNREAAEDKTPDTSVKEKDDVSNIMKLLSGLPFNQQEVVRLKFQGGLSYKEISEVTNLTVSNVGFLLHTALKTVRSQFFQASVKGGLS